MKITTKSGRVYYAEPYTEDEFREIKEREEEEQARQAELEIELHNIRNQQESRDAWKILFMCAVMCIFGAYLFYIVMIRR